MQKFQKKKNNYRKDNVDSNFLFAEISMRDQMAAMLKDYISEYSCDDINKMDSSGYLLPPDTSLSPRKHES